MPLCDMAHDYLCFAHILLCRIPIVTRGIGVALRALRLFCSCLKTSANVSDLAFLATGLDVTKRLEKKVRSPTLQLCNLIAVLGVLCIRDVLQCFVILCLFGVFCLNQNCFLFCSMRCTACQSPQTTEQFAIGVSFPFWGVVRVCFSCCFGVVLLDEDCNPVWGDYGRPLRLFASCSAEDGE